MEHAERGSSRRRTRVPDEEEPSLPEEELLRLDDGTLLPAELTELRWSAPSVCSQCGRLSLCDKGRCVSARSRFACRTLLQLQASLMGEASEDCSPELARLQAEKAEHLGTRLCKQRAQSAHERGPPA